MTWQGGLVDAEGASRLGAQFWRDATPGERLDAVVALAEDVWKLEGHDDPLRFQRTLGGVRRDRG